MTAYKDFISDFPRRCHKLLEMADSAAHLGGLDVTLALIVASAGLVIPYERLHPKKRHPLGDSIRYQAAAEGLRELLNGTFLDSALARGTSKTWHFAKLEELPCDLDAVSSKPLSKAKTTRTVIETIRNALAHGNIHMEGDPIQAIVLMKQDFKEVPDSNGVLTNKPNGYSFIKVSPADFRQFLDNWFEELNRLDIDQVSVAQVLKAAA
jgi:hypothetical protein